MTMVEQVEDAISEACQHQLAPHYLAKCARAAIEAMREPTDEMCDAADWQQQSEVIQYQLAIEAALAEMTPNEAETPTR